MRSTLVAFFAAFLSVSAWALDASTYRVEYKKLEAAKNWAEAEAYLKTGLAEHPNDAALNVFMGFTLRSLGRPLEAVSFLEKAVAVAPADDTAKANYAAGLADVGNDFVFRQKKPAEALPHYKKATEVAPKDGSYLSVYGNALRINGKHKEAYEAFAKMYALSPTKATEAGYKDNFRVGVTEGVQALKAAGDSQAAQLYGELGLKAYPNDPEFKGLLVGTATNSSDPAEKALADGLGFLKADKLPEAEAQFRAASSKAKTHDVDVAIAAGYRAKVEALAYDKQMLSPMQDKVAEYSARAVLRYFAASPYKNATKFYPPLKAPFCVGQGAGGKSFHYGLDHHYSWDLVGCNGASNAGAEIVAVADGTVTEVVNGNADHAPGAAVSMTAKANYVRIKHATVESWYVHVKNGSLKVKAGDAVKKGQTIAQVGNSGVSTGPHLHFQMTFLNKPVTVPTTFSGLYRGPVSAKKGAALKAATTLEMNYVYSDSAKL